MYRVTTPLIILVLQVLLSTATHAEIPVVEWTRQPGTDSDDYGYGVSVDESGNVYVTGITMGGLDGNTNAGSSDIFLTKYDTDGTRMWTQQLGNGLSNCGTSVTVDLSKNAYVTGWTFGRLDGILSAGSSDMLLSKYDTYGNKLWTRLLGTYSKENSYGVSVDDNGNAYVTGNTTGSLEGNTNEGSWDMFLTKYDTNGNKQWTRQLGSSSSDWGKSVSIDKSGNAYVTGRTYDAIDGNMSLGSSDVYLTKYNTYGNKLWTRQLGTNSFDDGRSVSVDNSGNVYITGYTLGDFDSNINAGGRDMFLTKYNPSGIKLWSVQLGSPSDDMGLGVSVDGSGNAYVTGVTNDGFDGNTHAGGSDIFMTKYDTHGNKLWTEQLGSPSDDISYGVSVDDRGNAYITGSTQGGLNGNTSTGGQDIFIVKISTIPEPSSLGMLMALCCMAMVRRRRR